MKQEAIFKKIGVILEELNEQHEYLTQNTPNFGELELDLFLANANFLADHIKIIQKIAANQVSVNNPIIETDNTSEIVKDKFEQEVNVNAVNYTDKKSLEEIIQNPAVEENHSPVFEEIEAEVCKIDQTPSTFEFILNDHSEYEKNEDVTQADNSQFIRDSFIDNDSEFNANDKFEFEEKSVNEIFDRPLSKEEERIIAEKKKLSYEPIIEEDIDEEEVGPEPFLVVKEEDFPIVKEDLTLELAPTPPVIKPSVELVEDPSNKPTLNELLAGKTQIVNGNTDKPAISDLKQAINLNDKLLYIKDLFNGYNLAYNEAIEIANKLPNFEAADNFFQKNYAVKNNWSDKQHTVDQFYELLNQRFK